MDQAPFGAAADERFRLHDGVRGRESLNPQQTIALLARQDHRPRESRTHGGVRDVTGVIDVYDSRGDSEQQDTAHDPRGETPPSGVQRSIQQPRERHRQRREQELTSAESDPRLVRQHDEVEQYESDDEGDRRRSSQVGPGAGGRARSRRLPEGAPARREEQRVRTGAFRA